jgi:4-hydroxy-3-methylbut-2-en-1-yl diphosphate synthase IspG/GcpE
MSWKEKMKEFGGGNFTFLSSDGETITFIVVGEPVLIKTMYKKQEQERVGCPVITDEGYQLFICGKRVARKITKHESVFNISALMVTRRGIENDANSSYSVKVVPEIETYARLKSIKDSEFKPEMVLDSIREASETLGE